MWAQRVTKLLTSLSTTHWNLLFQAKQSEDSHNSAAAAAAFTLLRKFYNTWHARVKDMRLVSAREGRDLHAFAAEDVMILSYFQEEAMV